MVKLIQPSLAGGEVSPAVATRVDVDKFKSSLTACENFLVMQHGGVTKRPGFKFVAEVRDSALATRIIPFSFNTEQTYVLEFGNLYMRVHKDGEQVLETGTTGTISAITAANPPVVTTGTHGYVSNQEVYIAGITGMTELNGRNFKITVISPTTFSLQDLDGNNIDATGYTAWSSGGTSDIVYTLTTVYTTAQLWEFKFAQTADEMTITHASHPIKTLTRTGHSVWTLVSDAFAPLQAAPTGLSVTPDAAASTTWLYQVTAVSDDTGEESLPASTNTTTGAATTPANTIAWTGAAGATVHNVYRADNGIYGYIGRTENSSFDDQNIDPVLTDTPPKARDPFNAANLYPAVPGFLSQRRVFANSNSYLQRIWLTQTGNHNNMSVSSPAADDDAITVTIAARQVNEIRHLVTLGDMIVFTSGAEWVFSGVDGVITPAGSQIAPQTYFGSTELPPITAGDVVIFMQPGQYVRDLSYKFEVDSYSGNDISILARHLFDEYTINDWTYAQVPHAQIWGVRDDGVAVGLTYVREQKIYAWARHTTLGDFTSVASVQEGDDDAIYAVIERKVNGRTVKNIERMGTFDLEDLSDAFYVDSGLSLDSPINITGYTQADPVVITTDSAHGFSNGDTVDINGVWSQDVTETRGKALSTEVVGIGYTVANVASTTFELQLNGVDVDGTGFAQYDSEGEVREAFTVVSGLWHLEGATVTGLANGYVFPDQTVTNGSITLPNKASRVHIGLPYNAEIETLRLDAGESGETVQGKQKHRTKLQVRLQKTMGMWSGPDREHMREAAFGLPALYGDVLPFFNGDKDLQLSPSWNKDGKAVIQQRDPLPMTILALISDAFVGGN